MRKKIEVTFIPHTSNDHLIENMSEAFKKVLLQATSSNGKGKNISNMLFPTKGSVNGGKINFTFFLYCPDGNFKDADKALESIIDLAVKKIELKSGCSIDQMIKTI